MKKEWYKEYMHMESMPRLDNQWNELHMVCVVQIIDIKLHLLQTLVYKLMVCTTGS